MAGKKYEKYIITDLKVPESADYTKWATRLFSLDEKVGEGSVNFTCAWYFKPSGKGLKLHSHDYTQIVGFFGSNPEAPYDLGGEMEMWLEDEQFILTKSFLLFIPKGLKHAGGGIRRVDRPIFHVGVTIK
jgi:hypothetical protein